MDHQAPKNDRANRAGNPTGGTRWPTLAAMAVLLLATIMEWYWVWGVLFLYWSIAAFVVRQAFVVQTIRRDEHPALFWFVGITWLVLAILFVFSDLFPDTAALWLGSASG